MRNVITSREGGVHVPSGSHLRPCTMCQAPPEKRRLASGRANTSASSVQSMRHPSISLFLNGFIVLEDVDRTQFQCKAARPAVTVGSSATWHGALAVEFRFWSGCRLLFWVGSAWARLFGSTEPHKTVSVEFKLNWSRRSSFIKQY